MLKMHVGGLVGVVLAVACSSSAPETERISVTEGGELGVVALEITFDETGFELRGLDAGDHEVGHVRLRVGEIADLQNYLPGPGNVGSEIILSVGDDYDRLLSREINTHVVRVTRDSDLSAFLELDVVASALRQRANILVKVVRGAETPSKERPLYVQGCEADMLLTSPVAGQCCFVWEDGDKRTLFVNPSGAVVSREANPYGRFGCRSQDNGSCEGNSCYFGPNGFGRPQISTSNPNPVIRAGFWEFGSYCFDDVGGDRQFPDLAGSFPTGQGCPGGGSGAGEWDY